MKKSLIAAAALALLASTGAKAADIVTYQQPAAAAPVSSDVNWNGVYVGGSIGGSWANSDTSLRGTNGVIMHGDDAPTTTNGKIAKKSVDPNSFIGGIYAGYNFQPTFLSNSFLKDVIFGVETDFMFNGGDGSGTKGFSIPITNTDPNTSVEPNNISGKYRASVRQKWNGATRLRVGYAFGPEKRIMPYFAAGVSYADIRAKNQIIADGGSMSSRSTKTRAGWNIGAGVDYVPPVLNDHIVLRAEYRFTDFGAGSFNKFSQAGDADTIGSSMKQHVKFNQNDFRVGVAYKF